jgi:anti-anti-sigma factor
MITWLLPGWLFGRAGAPAGEAPPREAPLAEPRDSVSLPAASRDRCPAVAAVEVAINRTCDDVVVRVKGEAKVEFAGALLDGLLSPAARRPAVVTLDLRGLRSISSLAMGVLVAYRRGVVCAGGRVRLVDQLQPAVREAMARAELLDLFEPTAGPGPRRSAAAVLPS